MPQFLAACLFIFVTACFGTLVSMLVMSQVYASVTVWSEMSLPQRLIVIGSPCIGALFGLVVILTSSHKRRQRAVAAAVTPAPAQHTAVALAHRLPQDEADLEAQVLQAQPRKLAQFGRPGFSTPLPSYTATDDESPIVPPPTYSRHAR